MGMEPWKIKVLIWREDVMICYQYNMKEIVFISCEAGVK